MMFFNMDSSWLTVLRFEVCKEANDLKFVSAKLRSDVCGCWGRLQ